MYVSDYLEGLIQGTQVRQMVRSECVALVHRCAPHLSEQLLPVANYTGGKCMGYPAVWFIQTALQIDDLALQRAVRESYSALFVSLSTSIADDFLDRNEAVTSAHLALMYLLLLDPLARPQRCSRGVACSIVKEIVDVAELFLSRTPMGNGSGMSNDRGKRIGSFHASIAIELTETLDVPKQLRSSIIEGARRFGHWCALLDDVIDIEQDIEEGVINSFPIETMIAEFPGTADSIYRRDVHSLGDFLVSPILVKAVTSRLLDHLRHIEDVLDVVPPLLKKRFEEMRTKLPSAIPALRRQAHLEAFQRSRVALDDGMQGLAAVPASF